MLEECLRGRQYCLDGYCFDGSVRSLGIVDAIMYPGTDAFMRWDYPSHLPEDLQRQAEEIAARFLQEVGFTHGLFNMEFVIDELSGQLKVIEFNPRTGRTVFRPVCARRWAQAARNGDRTQSRHRSGDRADARTHRGLCIELRVSKL